MTIKELHDLLSIYPDNTTLEDIIVDLSVESIPARRYIQSAYLADYRIAGGKPLANLHHMERQTNLAEVATALLHGLKYK